MTIVDYHDPESLKRDAQAIQRALVRSLPKDLAVLPRFSLVQEKLIPSLNEISGQLLRGEYQSFPSSGRGGYLSIWDQLDGLGDIGASSRAIVEFALTFGSPRSLTFESGIWSCRPPYVRFVLDAQGREVFWVILFGRKSEFSDIERAESNSSAVIKRESNPALRECRLAYEHVSQLETALGLVRRAHDLYLEEQRRAGRDV